MAKISKEEHDAKETWLRGYFRTHPSSSSKAANDAAFEVFGARVRNQTVYRIRQEVRDEMGLRVEDVQPRKGRPLRMMQKPPKQNHEENPEDQAQMFHQEEEEPPRELEVVPLDEHGRPVEKKKPPTIPGVGPASAKGRKKNRVLVEGSPEQLEYLVEVVKDLRSQGMTDLKISSQSEEFVVLERT